MSKPTDKPKASAVPTPAPSPSSPDSIKPDKGDDLEAVNRSTLLDEVLSASDGQGCIYANLLEARGLLINSSPPDAYIRLKLGRTEVYSRTLYGERNPLWDEEVSFNFSEDELKEYLVLTVYHERLLGTDTFLGEVAVPVKEYDANTLHDKWFKLGKSRDDPKSTAATVPPNAQLHLRFLYRHPHDQRSKIATPLRPMTRFFEALAARDMVFSRLLLRFLERADLVSTPAGERMLNALLTVHQNQTFRATMRLLNYCADQEAATAGPSANLFRRNSIAPKILSMYAFGVGSEFLQRVLEPLIRRTCESTQSFEIDPNRLPDREAVRRNQRALEARCRQFLDAICDAAPDIPIQLKWMAASLKTLVARHYPTDSSAVYNALSSFYFLRFICPAIVSPVHYGILQSRPSTQASRSLMLVVKTLQTLANGAGGLGQKDFVKEAYMQEMQSFVAANQPRITKLLDQLSAFDLSEVLPGFDKLDQSVYREALSVLHAAFANNAESLTALLQELLVSKQIELPRLPPRMLGEHASRTDSGSGGALLPTSSGGTSLTWDLYERAATRLSMQKHRRDPSKPAPGHGSVGPSSRSELKGDSIVSMPTRARSGNEDDDMEYAQRVERFIGEFKRIIDELGPPPQLPAPAPAAAARSPALGPSRPRLRAEGLPPLDEASAPIAHYHVSGHSPSDDDRDRDERVHHTRPDEQGASSHKPGFITKIKNRVRAGSKTARTPLGLISGADTIDKDDDFKEFKEATIEVQLRLLATVKEKDRQIAQFEEELRSLNEQLAAARKQTADAPSSPGSSAPTAPASPTSNPAAHAMADLRAENELLRKQLQQCKVDYADLIQTLAALKMERAEQAMVITQLQNELRQAVRLAANAPLPSSAASWASSTSSILPTLASSPASASVSITAPAPATPSSASASAAEDVKVVFHTRHSTTTGARSSPRLSLSAPSSAPIPQMPFDDSGPIPTPATTSPLRATVSVDSSHPPVSASVPASSPIQVEAARRSSESAEARPPAHAKSDTLDPLPILEESTAFDSVSREPAPSSSSSS